MRVKILRPFLLNSLLCAALAQIAYGQQNGGDPNPCVQDPDPQDGSVYIYKPVCDWVKFVMVAPEAQDGSQSGDFEIVMTTQKANSLNNVHIAYEWSHTTPSGAARVPSGDIFNDTTSDTPHVASAQWFATTGNQYIKSDNNPSGDPPTCTYDIKCTVTFGQTPGDVDSHDVTGTWSVFVYKTTPGVTPRSMTIPPNKFQILDIDESVQNTVTVVGHFMTETEPTYATSANEVGPGQTHINTEGMLPSNGFYNKIISGHEGEHVNQWTAGQWSGLYDVDAIFALYDGLTFSSSDQFDRTSWKNNRGYEIFDTCTAYRILCDAYKTNTWHNREIDAHNYSNSITPNFLEPDFSVEYTNPQQPLAPPPLPVRTPRNP